MTPRGQHRVVIPPCAVCVRHGLDVHDGPAHIGPARLLAGALRAAAAVAATALPAALTADPIALRPRVLHAG